MLQLRALVTPAFANRFFTAYTCAIVFAVILRYCFFDARDPSKCGALMNEGVWLDQPLEKHSDYVPREWQPPGCMIHNYKPADISTCLSGRRVVFAGDSTIRQLFWGVAKALDKDVDMSKAEMHSDITVEHAGVTMEFYWDPFLNSTSTNREIDMFEGDKYYRENSNRAALMLMGSGLWYARFETVNGMKKWKDNIDGIAQHMRYGRKTTDLTHQDLLLLAPVPVPAFEKLNEDRRRTITPQKILEMDQYLQQLSDIQGIDVVWALAVMTRAMPQTFEKSGLHLVDSVATKQTDLLLNLRCNAMLPPKYPYDKTCCMMYEPPNYQQWAGLFIVLAVLPVMSYLRSKAEAKGTSPPPWLPSDKITHALLVFGLSVAYCFYADRTQVFNKFHKHYTTFGFLSMTLTWLVMGYLTVGRSAINVPSQPFLSRHQTDEWKGWLQFAILVYHYTGASKIPWIYGFIRITVAAYLFMTGYGHAAYFYKKGDYSFKRVAGVLIRLNLLSCVLPYMMKTEYIFYYFAPLVTFWFIIIYITMRIGSQYNGNMRFLVSKIIVSAFLTALLVKYPGVLEALFEIPRVIAGTQWNVAEFRFRLSLDMWIVHIGMLTSILAAKLSDGSSPYSGNLPRLRIYAISASCVSLPLFFLFQTTRETKFIYNGYHPYISFIPILSFVVLRNATPKLRNCHSSIFAWLGKCSLETFTLQFHIWLAADTRGLLGLNLTGAYGRGTNFALATALFLFTSHCVAGATQDLTGWIMGVPEPKQALPTSKEEADKDRAEKGLGLKVKCAIILAGLWALNMTYTP